MGASADNDNVSTDTDGVSADQRTCCHGTKRVWSFEYDSEQDENLHFSSQLYWPSMSQVSALTENFRSKEPQVSGDVTDC